MALGRGQQQLAIGRACQWIDDKAKSGKVADRFVIDDHCARLGQPHRQQICILPGLAHQDSSAPGDKAFGQPRMQCIG